MRAIVTISHPKAIRRFRKWLSDRGVLDHLAANRVTVFLITGKRRLREIADYPQPWIALSVEVWLGILIVLSLILGKWPTYLVSIPLLLFLWRHLTRTSRRAAAAVRPFASALSPGSLICVVSLDGAKYQGLAAKLELIGPCDITPVEENKS
jgi:hypothetical protein